MAQILSIYGLVAAVIISNSLVEKMPIHTGFMQFGAGLAVGLCGMSAGFAIGIVGDSGGKDTIPLSPLIVTGHSISGVLFLGGRKTDGISESKLAAAETVCWYGAHSYLRGSLGSIWGYCQHFDVDQVQDWRDRVSVLIIDPIIVPPSSQWLHASGGKGM